ncbi:MAG: alpha-L-rhamnosidase C-terminal domain-containing protein [Balneolaceae bacterium]|nr:alpha-L-rhamnosidase C-terminal domain-containing protein [Balneolaceae bacterium]
MRMFFQLPLKKNGFEISSLSILFLSFCTLFISCTNSEKINLQAPKGLIIELLRVPEEAVITDPQPEFGWIVNDSRRGAMQSAWQILVSSDKERIQNDQGDMWNSGKTDSDQSTDISYAGKPLEPNTVYWWKVRTWDQHGEVSAYSTPQKFNTGDFNNEERSWPGESHWVQLDVNGETKHVFENRHPIRYHEVKPVSVVRNSAGNHFIRFEKAAFGALKLTLDAPENADTLIVHLGEDDTSENMVNKNPGGSITYNQVKVALKPGKSEYIVEIPRFVSNYPNSQVLADHMPEVTAFRYAEIEGWEGDLQPDQIRQLALLYHFDDEASYFQSSDDNLNQIWELSKHTLKVTPFMGVYIDGGARERMPYEADAYVQQISHYSVDREFAIQRYTTNFLIFNPSWPTEWHLHIVLMAWADYMATGNSEFLEKYYDELKKKTLLALAREDGLISTRTGLVTNEFLESIHYQGDSIRDIVDWPQGTPANETELRSGHGSVSLAGETDRYIFSDINTVVNAFHYRNLVLMAKIAGVLDKTEDEQFFNERSELVKKSMNEKLLDEETGLYRDGEGVDHHAFHASMFPVAFGIAPEENYPQIRDFLISKGMASSPYGAPYLFDALYELGAEDYAFELLTSETDRSWMNMIRFGTTITSEAWDLKYKQNMTWNHAWGASPAYIITRGIFGIQALEPAYKTVLIKPQPGELQSAEIKSPTIRGPIHAKFNSEPEGVFSMELVIPANTNARVMLPKPDKEDFTLQLNGDEVSYTIEEESVLIDDLEAGKYRLELQ